MSVETDITLPDKTSDLRQQYVVDGVVPVSGLLSGQLLSDIIEEVETFRETAELLGSATGSSGNQASRTSVKHLPGRSIVRGLAHTQGSVSTLVTNPSVAAFLAQVVGVDAVRYWNDLTLAYAPAAPAGESAWHHDLPAFPLRATEMPTLWIALSDVDWDSSPLVYARGSHVSGQLYPPTTATDVDLPEGYTDMPDWDALVDAGSVEKVWWPMKPGDALIMHAKVVHCTPANRNKKDERVSIITRWIGDDAVWHRDPYSTPIQGLPEQDWQPGEPITRAFV